MKKRVPIRAIVVVATLVLVGWLLSPALARDKKTETRPTRNGQKVLLNVMKMLDGVSTNEESSASPFLPPGHGGTPPGQGGTPPGQTTPPGQGGTPPGQQGRDKNN